MSVSVPKTIKFSYNSPSPQPRPPSTFSPPSSKRKKIFPEEYSARQYSPIKIIESISSKEGLTNEIIATIEKISIKLGKIHLLQAQNQQLKDQNKTLIETQTENIDLLEIKKLKKDKLDLQKKMEKGRIILLLLKRDQSFKNRKQIKDLMDIFDIKE